MARDLKLAIPRRSLARESRPCGGRIQFRPGRDNEGFKLPANLPAWHVTSMAAADWAQASSDWAKAVTVIVPALCTAAVVLLVARWNRSHDLEKERRRRKQDFIEKVVSDFDNLQVLLQETLKLTLALSNTPMPETARNAIIEELQSTMEDVDEAHLQLSRLPGKLRLLDYDDCADKLEALDLQATMFKQVLIMARKNGETEELASRFQYFIGDTQSLRDSLKQRYSQL